VNLAESYQMALKTRLVRMTHHEYRRLRAFFFLLRTPLQMEICLPLILCNPLSAVRNMTQQSGSGSNTEEEGQMTTQHACGCLLSTALMNPAKNYPDIMKRG
jgi:hypothetical protein